MISSFIYLILIHLATTFLWKIILPGKVVFRMLQNKNAKRQKGIWPLWHGLIFNSILWFNIISTVVVNKAIIKMVSDALTKRLGLSQEWQQRILMTSKVKMKHSVFILHITCGYSKNICSDLFCNLVTSNDLKQFFNIYIYIYIYV